MIDNSASQLMKNNTATKKVVNKCSFKGGFCRTEVGTVGGTEDGVTVEFNMLTQECLRIG